MSVDEIKAACVRHGINPAEFLSKKADCNGDAHKAEVGKQSETPHGHSADPIMKTDMTSVMDSREPDPARKTVEERHAQEGTAEPDKATPKEPAVADSNEPKYDENGDTESKQDFVQKAATLAVAMHHLKMAGLLRADLLKIAADALDVTPDYYKVLTSENVIANAKAEDGPDVVAKIRQEKTAAAKLQDNMIWKVASQLANDAFVEE